MAEETEELCDCGYPDGSFACKIRHQAVMTGNTEARKHDAEIRARRQEEVYGV